jgi:hypothetical protein
MACGNTQVRDQEPPICIASHLRVSSYLASNDGQGYLTYIGSNVSRPLYLPADNSSNSACRTSIGAKDYNGHMPEFWDFLPVGFTSSTTNSYGQTYAIRILKDNEAHNVPAKSYSFMIVTQGGDQIPDTSGGRISSMIGNDGGFMYETNVCGVDTACGAFGSWSASPVVNYGFSSGTATAGRIVSRTNSGMNASQMAPWLARTKFLTPTVAVVGGTASDLNTIQTDTYFGYSTGTTPAVLYGSATDGYYGGQIERVRKVMLGRLPTEPEISSADAALYLTSCDPIAKANCADIMTVTGGVGITGLLKATNLYAQKFVYDENSTPSDMRLKKDVHAIENVLDKMAELKGYEFTMKESGTKKYGLIAQEVEKVFPLAVGDIGDGYKGLDYTMLVGPLVQAVNALREENRKLKTELTALSEEVKGLKPKSKKK